MAKSSKEKRILKNGKTYRVFEWGGSEYHIRAKFPQGKRKKLTGKQMRAFYEEPKLAEKAKQLDFSKPQDAQSLFAGLLIEYGMMHPDEMEFMKLDAIVEPAEGSPSVREMYYEGDGTEEEAQAMLDFFEPPAKSKTVK
jgi:hypothetical protein